MPSYSSGFYSKTLVYNFRLGLRFALTLGQEQQEEAWNGIEFMGPET